ncbi:hypothetical protein ABTY96_09685 [Streptomyces sp. NPDC096057]|uniref:hypothetical protein n=1 Tax=Streptomyces sp. NPDC096057 TaxID=3155543 RepID=UPI0033253776
MGQVYGVMGEAYAELAALPRWSRAGIRAWLDEAAADWREMASVRRVANAAAPAALRSLGEGRTQYVEAHERYVAMPAGPPERWRGVDPAEARQRALMAVLQTESFLAAWIAVEWPLGTADPLRLPADSLCHLLAPAVENNSAGAA